MKRQGQNKKKVIIGVTGSFGSGKTTVARIIKSFGAQVIDLDQIAHAIIKPKGKIYKKIVKRFGDGILKENKTIDRRRLANIVFNNKNSLQRLNRIMHPEIIRIIKNKIEKSSQRIIVLDAPLLLEAGLRKIVDKLIVVTISPKKKQIERIRNKITLARPDILKRINAQMGLGNKVRLADFVIDNSRDIDETIRQVEKIRRLLWRN